MKKPFAVLATGAMLATLLTPMAAYASGFTDISSLPADEQQAINTLAQQGVINGTSATTFSPFGTLTRAQFAKIVDLAAKIQVNTSATQSQYFNDIPAADAWAIGYIDAAKKNGIMDGTSATTFSPDAPVTREMAAKILVSALGYQPDANPNLSMFSDASQIDSWAKGYVSKAVSLGLIKGLDNGTFGPLQAAQRYQAAVLALRFENTPAAQALKVTGSATSASVGQQVTFTVNQGTPTWSVSPSGAVIDQNGNFVASQPGTYTVTATEGSQSATATVTVYGQAAAVKLSTPTPLVANGVSTETITATVVDANGNTVQNFNGLVNAYYTAAGSYATQFEDANGNAVGNPTTVAAGLPIVITNGVGNITLLANKTPGLTDTINVGNLSSSNNQPIASNVSYPSNVTVSSVAQTPTSIKVTPASPTLAANQANNTDVIQAEILDQTGNVLVNGQAYTMTFNISGAATFAGGSTQAQTSSFIANPGSPTQASATIYSENGVTGPITITVTGAGLTGSATVNAVTAQNASKLVLTDTTDKTPGTFIEGISTATLTLGAQDPNGTNVSLPTTASGHSYVVYVTNSQGGAATNISVNGTPVPANGSGVALNVTASPQNFTISDSTGKPNAGTYTVVVKDNAGSGALAATPNFTVTEQAGPASTITLTVANAYIPASNPATTFTAQVVDVNGNPVSKAGIPVTFTASNGGGSAQASLGGGAMSTAPSYTTTTNSSGVATASFNAQSYTGVTWTIMATPANGYGLNGSPTATTQVVYSPTSALKVNIGSQYSGGTISGSLVGAGASIYTMVTQLDQYGNPINIANENDTVTVTFSPSSGVTLAAPGAGITETATANTVSLKGTVSALNAWLTTANNVTGAASGTVTVTVTDNSVPTATSGTGSITVTQGTATQVIGLVNGAQTQQTITQTGVAGPYTLQISDAGKNPTTLNNNLTLTLSEVESILGIDTGNPGSDMQIAGIRTTSSGSDSNTVTINAGTSTATIYLDVTSTGTAPYNSFIPTNVALGTVAPLFTAGPSATWSNTVSGVNYVFSTTTVPALSASVSPDANSVQYYIQPAGSAAVLLGTVVPTSGAANLNATAYSMTDGRAYTIYAVATDAAGNQMTSSVISFTADAAPAAATTNPITATKAAGPNYSANDTITLTFSKAISVSSLALTNITLSGGHSFGTGATLAAVNAVNGYATQFEITLGTAPTVASSDTLTVTAANVVDYAGQPAAGNVTFTAP